MAFILPILHISRVGLSQLTQIGLPELIAGNFEEYVNIAKNMAENIKDLNMRRMGLRNKMQHSPLMNAEEFIIDFEAELEKIWRQYIANTEDKGIYPSH